MRKDEIWFLRVCCHISNAVYHGLFPWGTGAGGLNLTTGPHLVLRLKFGGAVPVIAPYAIIAWTGVALPLTLYQPKSVRGSFVGEGLCL